MSELAGPSIHASAVLIGEQAVLIRGPSGSGKSRLAFELILAGRAGQIPSTSLIGDDRVHLEVREGRLIVRPSAALAGLIEIRGLGIRRMPFVGEAPLGLVVDLNAEDAERLPLQNSLETTLSGVKLRRIPVGSGVPALLLVAAALTTTKSDPAHPTYG